MLAKIYERPVAERMLMIFTESPDAGVKDIIKGVWDSLPKMSRAEALIRAGDREAGLRIGNDLAAAIDVLVRLRQDKASVEEFLRPGLFPNDRITPFQAQILRQLDQLKSSARIREFLNRYADLVVDSPIPVQQAIFTAPAPTRDDLFEQARVKTGGITREQEPERLARWQAGLSPEAVAPAPVADNRPGATDDGRGGLAPAVVGERAGVAEPEPVRPDEPIGFLPEGEQPAGGDRDRGLSEPGGTDRGSVLRSSGPGIVIARGEFTHPVDPRELAQGDVEFVASKGDALDTCQRQGVYTAVRWLDRAKGFLLADGTGVGKTREILSVADLYAQKGYKVPIVAPRQAIDAVWAKTVRGVTSPARFSGSYRDDAKALGVTLDLSRNGSRSLDAILARLRAIVRGG